MNTTQLIEKIAAGAFDNLFETLYGKSGIAHARERYTEAINSFTYLYGKREGAMLFSVAGRSEISGNHTDHNYGKVIAASVDCDIIAVAAPSEGNVVRIKSEKYKEDRISLQELHPDNFPKFKSASLVAGMCHVMRDAGFVAEGFDAYTTSNVLKGSGLSSSAAFEVMVGNILNHLYNDGKIDNTEIAKFAQWSEIHYFGKPCGLMDQMACAVGGFVKIDFADPKSPIIEKKVFDLDALGYNLCIINTGGNHSDLNDDYAAIPSEMKAVAAYFGKEVLRGVTMEQLLEHAAEIRLKTGDRALLRAMHFVCENDRVDEIGAAMDEKNIENFLAGLSASGNSSFKWLQNVFTVSHPAEQGVSLTLAVAERSLKKAPRAAACRVHGGGFAGTVQAFVPTEYVETFRKDVDKVMGEGACMIMRVRPYGAIRVDQ